MQPKFDMLISYSDSSRDRTRTKTLGKGVNRKRCGIVTNSVGWRLERRSGNGSKPKPPDQRNSSACLPYSATENGRRGVRRSDAAARAPSDGRTDGRGWNPESLERPERKKSRLLSFFSPPISAPLRPIPFFRFALFTAPLAASQSAIGIRPVGNPASIRQREKLVGRSVGHGVVVRKSVGRSIEKSSFSATEAERNCLW